MNKILNNISASLNTTAELSYGTRYKRRMKDERESHTSLKISIWKSERGEKKHSRTPRRDGKLTTTQFNPLKMNGRLLHL